MRPSAHSGKVHHSWWHVAKASVAHEWANRLPGPVPLRNEILIIIILVEPGLWRVRVVTMDIGMYTLPRTTRRAAYLL